MVEPQPPDLGGSGASCLDGVDPIYVYGGTFLTNSCLKQWKNGQRRLYDNKRNRQCTVTIVAGKGTYSGCAETPCSLVAYYC
jgi:hypothetical protein